MTSNLARGARYVLAGIRLVNGALGLVAPHRLIERIDPGSGANPAAVYAFRLFGVRTVLLGAELIVSTGERRREVVRQGVLIHASDTVASALLGIRGLLPRRTALMLVLISATNTALALTALEEKLALTALEER
ncbi:hypothetical protein ACTOB_003262 [Actinoplanes oblitus]|uniref:DUF4267 domain-containing protein n=1 Tax=Actinoplanes oblitus TaxID=3040509 RepID=A0ABY8WQ90_9ACTN|nr:hypothetical protein [Actinoplanes oblitus]WIM99602.1 hypothetical protein ACTOB_003262 [Actinoplanes oblitus]